MIGMTKNLLKWSILALIVGVLAGITSWAFLHSLDWAITFRRSHSWMVVLLPIAGLITALFYRRFGQSVEAGNNLILEEIHEPKKLFRFE